MKIAPCTKEILIGDEPVYGELNYKKYGPYKSEEISQSPGLTIRQHFAGLALQGLLSNKLYDIREFRHSEFAEDAVKFADALITQLNK